MPPGRPVEAVDAGGGIEPQLPLAILEDGTDLAFPGGIGILHRPEPPLFPDAHPFVGGKPQRPAFVRVDREHSISR